MNAFQTLSQKLLGPRTPGGRLLLPLLAVALACIIGLAARTSAREEPRTITLTARGMAFYLDGNPTPNPPIVLRRGEDVRLTLINQDRGMTHDFAISSLDLATSQLRRAGGATTVNFEAPEEPGESEYVCTLHARMMKGIVRVE